MRAVLVLTLVLLAPSAGFAPNVAAYTPPPPVVIPPPGLGDVATWRAETHWLKEPTVVEARWSLEGLGEGWDRNGNAHPALRIARSVPELRYEIWDEHEGWVEQSAVVAAPDAFALDLRTGGLLERDRVDVLETADGLTTRAFHDDRTDVGEDLVPFTALWNRTLTVGGEVTGTIDHRAYGRDGSTTYRIAIGDWTPHKGWMMIPVTGIVTTTTGSDVATQIFEGWWLHLDAWPWTLTIHDARGTVHYDRLALASTGEPAPLAAGPAARLNGPPPPGVNLRSWTADGATDTTLPFRLQSAVAHARERAWLDRAPTVADGQLIAARYAVEMTFLAASEPTWTLTFATRDATQTARVQALTPVDGVAIPTRTEIGTRGAPPAFDPATVAGLLTMDFEDVATSLEHACGLACPVDALQIGFFESGRFEPRVEARSDTWNARVVHDALTGSRDLGLASWERPV